MAFTRHGLPIIFQNQPTAEHNLGIVFLIFSDVGCDTVQATSARPENMQLISSKSILKYSGEEKKASPSSDGFDNKRVVCKRVAASLIIIVVLLTSVLIRLLVPMPHVSHIGSNSVNMTNSTNITIS